MIQRILVCAMALGVAGRVFGEVSNVGPGGFAVRFEVVVKAPPEKVSAAVIRDVGRWWDPEHTYSGDSKNLSIEARAGGCFCERLPEGGGVQHMTVVYLAPGRAVRMTGGLGPLQSAGVSGSMTWTFTGVEAATKLEVSYNVGGFMPGGFEKIAPGVDAVLGAQLARLKSWVETGKAATEEKS
jgi:uncharacterized protein YndB with AHSA1/START domain